MTKAQVVRFADYRQYEQVRTEASNAVMGLLAGARMAEHMLQLTEGSDRLLPEMFPQIPHIGRLNLKTGAARGILAAGDTHLGAMAVPYALAIHEDYLRTCLTLLKRGGANLYKPPDDLKLAFQHAEMERSPASHSRRPAWSRSTSSADAQLHHPLRRRGGQLTAQPADGLAS